MRSDPISPANANRLYLISMVLLTSVGIAIQAWSSLGGLIATELFVILVPALVFLRTYHLPVVNTVNWHWPNLPIGIASLSVGLGTSLIAIRFSQFISFILGYEILPTPSSLPQNFNQILLLILGYLILAPVCEEFLFRGVLLTAYKTKGFWAGILISALLFAMFHLSLIKLLALLPIAILLGYIALQTQSLQASILAHFAYNLPATLLLALQGTHPELPMQWVASAQVTGLAWLLVLAGLWWINRTTSRTERPSAIVSHEFWFNWAWPIMVSSLFFIFFAGMEVVQARYPELIAQNMPSIHGNQWMPDQDWHYELRDILDAPVGTAHCSRVMLEETIALTCQMDLNPFEAKTSTSFFKTDGYSSQSRFEWDQTNLQLVAANYIKRGENDLSYRVRAQFKRPEPGRFRPRHRHNPPGSFNQHISGAGTGLEAERFTLR